MFRSTERSSGRSPEAEFGVEGERDIPIVARTASLQSRVANVLTVTVLMALSATALFWYYRHAATGSAPVGRRSPPAPASRVSDEAALPPLGPIVAPVVPTVSLPSAEPTPIGGAANDLGTLRLPQSLEAVPLRAASAAVSANVSPGALERRLAGSVFVAASASGMMGTASVPSPDPKPHTAVPNDVLTGLLQAAPSDIVRASVEGEQRLLLPKGSFIDCTLETAIDSSLPGMTTCVTATDTFGADGSVVLLDRGTKLVGQTRGQMQQGQARVFVLWTQARTPAGVLVPLDSPGADELGRSGLPGEIERHFWERFGSAVLISSIDAAVQSAVQSATRAGTVVYNPSASQDVSTEVLKSTLNIAPTVIKRNGDRIQVLVARDLDFSRVYALRAQPGR